MSEPVTGRSAGALLRAAREKQGLHIAALAAAIKVAPRKLDALENDRLTDLPDATFARALAQTVCRTLKVDARPILDLLPPASTQTFAHAGGGLNAPFRERPGREEPNLGGPAVRPLAWAAALLLLAALAVYFWPGKLWPPNAAVPLAAPAASAAALVAAPLPASAAASAATLGLAESALAASAAAPAASSSGGETVFSVPQQPQPDAAPPAGLVQLRTAEASWMDARDARGQVLLSRTVLPGESVGLDGALPIRMTIGNASAVQLGFRGQAIDLAPNTRDNVARLELK